MQTGPVPTEQAADTPIEIPFVEADATLELVPIDTESVAAPVTTRPMPMARKPATVGVCPIAMDSVPVAAAACPYAHEPPPVLALAPPPTTVLSLPVLEFALAPIATPFPPPALDAAPIDTPFAPLATAALPAANAFVALAPV